jgi:hypothetical protein
MNREGAMKWIAVIGVLCISALIPSIGHAGDFRNATWGMMIDEVKQAEKEAVFVEENESRLLYKSTVLNMPVHILYTFDDSKLSSGSYFPGVQHSNPYGYIIDYERIKASLTEKYGKPIKDDKKRIGKGIFDSAGDEGYAVGKGELEYASFWKIGRTDILLTLTGDNMKISLVWHYQDANLKSNSASSEGI